MFILNGKIRTVPYSKIIAVLIFATICSYSFKALFDVAKTISFKIPNEKSDLVLINQNETSNSALIELFTSEGCSSCPSADNLVAEAQKEFNEKIIVLSYHVDYWDRLGWKDAFSKSAFSERQRQYAQHLNLESIYTPQAIVNGKVEFVGSDKSKLWSAISKYQSENNNVIETEPLLVSNQQLTVKYNCSELSANEIVVFELVLKNATTIVKRGENGGSTLSHINIVQDIMQKNEDKGMATFSLPKNFTKENYFVVAFVQNNNFFEIKSAKKITII